MWMSSERCWFIRPTRKKARQDFRAWRQHTGIAAPAHNNMYAQQPASVMVESFILAMTFSYQGKRPVSIPAAAHTFERCAQAPGSIKPTAQGDRHSDARTFPPHRDPRVPYATLFRAAGLYGRRAKKRGRTSGPGASTRGLLRLRTTT